MNSLRKHFPISCQALICLVVAAFPIMAATWDAIDLGTLGGNRSEATAINIQGQVAGWSETTNSSRHGFSWTRAGGMIDLGTLNDRGSHATYVTDGGQVIGYDYFYWAPFGRETVRAFSWTAQGGLVDIGVLPGMIETYIQAVSPSGQVVGYCSRNDRRTDYRGFSWTSTNGMIDLGPVLPTAVNKNGMVVGYTSDYEAFAWTAAGGLVRLGTLPGYPISLADHVNDAGMVVGSCERDNILDRRGFVWTTNGGMIDVGHLGGGSSYARFVSSNGTVVGYSARLNGQWNTFAWTASRGMTNLGAAGGVDSSPLAMNRNGLVMGYATGANQAWQYAFAWSGSNAMVALTLGGNSFPKAISEGGHIVGVGFTSGGGGRGFLWTEANEITTLLPFPRGGGGAIEVTAVNSRGQVVGWSSPGDWGHAAIWQQPPPILRLERSTVTPGTFELHVSQLVTNTVFTVERTVNFSDWESLGQHVATANSHTVPIVLASNMGYAFYRIRIP